MTIVRHLGRVSASALVLILGLVLGMALTAPARSAPNPFPPTTVAPASPDPALLGDLRWRQLGPFRGGWATMVEGVPGQPDTFFFAAAGGGVWRTDDAGQTWRSLFDQGPAAAVGALAAAPSDPKTLYIGTGQPEPRYDIAAGYGVFKSSDGGATWTDLGLKNTRYIGRIWVDPTNPDTVLVGAQGHFFGESPDRGVYRSTDGGKTWSHTLALGPWTGVVDLASDPKDPKVIFAAAWEARQYPWQSYFTKVAGGGSGVYKSTDGGVTWTRLSGGGWPEGALGRISLAVTDTAAGARVYAVVDSGKAGGLYRSDDGGGHWIRATDEDAISSYYANRVTVDPRDPDVVYTVGQSVRRCVKGGTTCEIIRGSPGGDDYHFVWINPLHPDHMITGSDQGAAVSVNGGATWSSWYNQPTGQFYHLAADDRFPYWIYSGQQDSGTVGIASRSDYGALSLRDWRPIGGDERDYDIPDPTDPNIVFASGLGGRVSKWDARTGQVQDVSAWPVSSYGKRPTLSKYHYIWVTPLVASRTGPPTLYLGAQLLFRSRDRGLSWTTISPDLTGKTADAQRCDGDVAIADAKPCGYGSIAAIAPSPRHADEVWVGTDDGLIQLTRDGGATWTNVTPPSVPLWAKVATLDVSALEDGVAYAVIDGQRLDDFQPHILRTRDYGRTWKETVTGLPRDHFAAVVRADPVKAGLLYAGTDVGVFVSVDDGDHWRSLQHNLPTAWVRDLLVHGDDLVAATQGRAIWLLDDVTPLRQLTPDLARRPAHLFTPAEAIRVHPDNNKDTPPAPETPLGENPPAGAILDYWLGAAPKGPVVLEIRDGAGALVRRFASDDKPEPPRAERYFAAAWTRPAAVLSAAPGMHRFVWSLHYPRPRAIGYEYSIAAVWGQDTPTLPEGPFVTPGTYQVTLRVEGQSFAAPLTVKEDPRIPTSAADLKASLDLSLKLGAGLARDRLGYGEAQAVHAGLAALLAAKDLAAGPLRDQAQALQAELDKPTPKGELGFEAIAGQLGRLEGDLESADVAPTAVQNQVAAETLTGLESAWGRWTAFKTGPLAALNAGLVKAGRKPIVPPPADRLEVEAPDPGQDLP
jgi:photosystem II stability/assembly factor-like uncharacterized protein